MVSGNRRRLRRGVLLLGISAAASALCVVAIAMTQNHQASPVIALDNWRLVTDGVMGGVSEGRFTLMETEGVPCLHLSGDVSTRNNGGFIQIARDIDPANFPAMSTYRGIRLKARGNQQDYNLHLRTHDLWFPWQAYRATFHAGPDWSTVEIPFDSFTPYKTSTGLDISRLKRVGIVAIGRDFTADICVADITFYP